MVPRKLLTTEHLAALLSVSQRTVCLWAECGTLPAIKIGKQWRFCENEIESWLTLRKDRVEPPRIFERPGAAFRGPSIKSGSH
jgi:excisionase family DNA binding protein